jgi:hypothetical protein
VLNWSLPAVALRIADPPRGDGSLPHNWVYGNYLPELRIDPAHRRIAVCVAAVTLIAGILFSTLAWKGRLSSGQWPWACAALLALALAAAPVAWTHYQILQYPGMALLLSSSIRQQAWLRTGAFAVLCSLLYVVPVAILGIYYRAHGGWTGASAASLYFWTSVTPMVSLVLFALLIRSSTSEPFAWLQTPRDK